MSKMTDKEIIKELEYQVKYGAGNPKALDLINRQQLEIERLQRLFEQEEKSKNSLTKKCYKDGIKEFAERLKKLSRNLYPFSDEPIIDCKDIDNLVKEMVGEGK